MAAANSREVSHSRADVPSGHYGNLTAEQQKALEDLHKQVVDFVTQHNSSDDCKSRSHVASDAETLNLEDEEFQRMLLRFLRARSFKVPDAFDMFSADHTWRLENGVNELLERPPKKLDLAHSCVPGSHHKYDKTGRPIRIEAMGHLLSSRVPELFSHDEYRMIHAWDMEYVIKQMDENSKRLDREVEQLIFIGDMKGLTMNARKAIWLVRAISAMDELHYPERCGVVFLINCPWVFPALYNNLVKPFLDPVVAQKVRVFEGCPTKEFLEIIDADSLPKMYGGNCVCEGGCVPSPSKEAVQDAIDNLAPQNLKKHKISASKYLQVRVDVHEKDGAALDWFFKMGSKGGDIDFSAHWHPNPDMSPSSSPSSPSPNSLSPFPKKKNRKGISKSADFDQSGVSSKMAKMKITGSGAQKVDRMSASAAELEQATSSSDTDASPRERRRGRVASEPIASVTELSGGHYPHRNVHGVDHKPHELHARQCVKIDRFGSDGEFLAQTSGSLILRWDNNSTWTKKTVEFSITKTRYVETE